MRIGIPKALLYYYYYPFWKGFFDVLELETVVSDSTSKDIIDKGIRYSVPEICVPIKVFNGHIMNLYEKGVDYIFVPRMVKIRKGETFCPKFLGLPDILRFGVIPEEKMLFPYIYSKNDLIRLDKNLLELGKGLGFSRRKIKKAYKEAKDQWLYFRFLTKKGYNVVDLLNNWGKRNILEIVRKINEKKYEVKIGLVGYVYNLYDGFLNMRIIDKLKNMGVNIVTFDYFDEAVLEDELKVYRKKLFWTFSNKLWGAGLKFFKSKDVDGIIHVTAFGCGPDSMLGKIFEIDSDKYDKPFMTLRIDEHTGENHLLTRVEAFVDMIKRVKYGVLERAGNQ